MAGGKSSADRPRQGDIQASQEVGAKSSDHVQQLYGGRSNTDGQAGRVSSFQSSSLDLTGVRQTFWNETGTMLDNAEKRLKKVRREMAALREIVEDVWYKNPPERKKREADVHSLPDYTKRILQQNKDMYPERTREWKENQGK